MYLTKTFFGIAIPENLKGSHCDQDDLKLLILCLVLSVLAAMYFFIRGSKKRESE